MTATTILKVEDLSLSQVRGIPASSAEAQPLIAHYVSGMNSELWSRLRPLSVVVVNSTDRSIVGYSVQWEFTLLDGKKQTRGYHYGQPDAVLDGGRTKIPPEHRVNARMIEPLASQLVFPMTQISHPTQLSHGISASSGDQLKDIELLAMESSRVVFTLDAVLLDNGVVLGPDTTQFADAYRSAFAGEQDIVRFIVTSAAAGVPDTDVIEEVRTRRDKSASALAGHMEDNSGQVYNTSLFTYANEFLNVQKISGYESAVSVAREHLYQSSPHIASLNKQNR
jgi:hypothetical protein